MRTRAYLPPPTCVHCSKRPMLGETLFVSGSVWLCADCLTNESDGIDVMSKLAPHAVQMDMSKALSRRARAAGDIEAAAAQDRQAKWNQHAVNVLHDRGTRLARGVEMVNSEVVPRNQGYLKDTLADPDLAAVESSETRGRLLLGNDIVALGVDVSNTVKAANTAEKLVAHEIALAHKVAMEQARRAQRERDPAIELKRLQISARMMATVQQGVLTLLRLKTGGTQNVVVQHVYVESGGQAVMGNIQAGQGRFG